MSSAAWTRKEGQDPAGGLNARGRAAYKAATGGTLRPPVKSGDDPRRASFLARMGAVRGPMVRDGKPTRLALAVRAWGASSKEDARKKARAISRRLREGNQMKKTRRNPIKGAGGKFGGESYVAKWVYETADGTDELGSVDELGWYVKYSGKVKGRGPFHLIVREDSQGFVRGEFYNTEKELDRAWNGIERAYDEFYGEQDDN